MDSLSAAQGYVALGWSPIPVPRGCKAPVMSGWQNLRLTPPDLAEHFSGQMNIGLLLGDASAGLIDVDLDVREALSCADAFLPATGRIHGRAGRPRSHWWYLTESGVKPKKFQDLDGTCLVELRSTGQQTIVPPSVHPSGERLTWDHEGQPARVDTKVLHGAVSRLAACALLARHWPKAGSRQDCALAVAGALLRAGWTLGDTKAFLGQATGIARDEEAHKRVDAVEHTAQQLSANGHVTGLPKLSELLGEKVVATLVNWLAIAGAARERSAEARAAGKPSPVERLVQLTADLELFHTSEHEAFASIPVGDYRDTVPVGSRDLENWLTRQFYLAHGQPPSAQALADVVRLLEAKALYDGPEYPVFLRLGQHDGAMYLDLANPQREAVEITPAGWAVIANPPLRLRRTPGMLPLPRPVVVGALNELRSFVNAPDMDSFRLLLAWLVMALRPTGPYPVLALQGEQGSAKSTTARVLGALIDPCTTPLRALPRDERDLMIAAKNSWILALDNLSGLPLWLSDALCRLVTGAGLSTRALYTNDEEIHLHAQRPVILNGIDELATRHDLIDRALPLTLPPIPEHKREDEETFWARFDAARPRILGALLDAVSEAMRRLPDVKLTSTPRMADFARWATAAESALGWPTGGFIAAYTGNRTDAVEAGLDAHPLAPAIRALLAKDPTWSGTASELLRQLKDLADQGSTESRAWPKSYQQLGTQLRRLSAPLRSVGIEVNTVKGKGGKQRITTLRDLSQTVVRDVRGPSGSLKGQPVVASDNGSDSGPAALSFSD